jgi:hypothetical protein
MYLKLEEVILVSDKSRLKPEDPVVYKHNLRGERILTLDPGPCEATTDAMRYGRLYFDVKDNPCVVPDTQEQFEVDYMCARDWR